MLSFLKDKKLFVFLMILSLILFIHTFYKAEIIWNGANNKFYLQYYILSFLFFCIGLTTLFLSSSLKKIFIIFFISIIFSFYLFEFYDAYIKEKKKIVDNRFNVFQNMREETPNLTMMIPPKSYLNFENIDFFPLSGLSNMKTVFCNENGYMSIYDSDRYGFNNPDEQWDYNEIEYFVVGDSFGHGACVNRPNDIASKLRKYSNLPTINVSFSGNGPLSEYASLLEYSKNKSIKNIVWLFYEGNDYSNLNDELKNEILVKYFKDENFYQNLKSLQSKTDTFGEKIISAEEDRYKKIKNTKFISFLKLNNLRKYIQIHQVNFDKKDQPINEFNEIFKKVYNKAESLDAKLIFVYLPEYKSFELNSSNQEIYFETLSNLKNKNVQIIDVREYFKNNDPHSFFPFRKNGHYTIEGYDKIAKLILGIKNDD